MTKRLNPLFLLIISMTMFLAACSDGPVTGPRRFNLAAEPTLVPTSEAVARPVYTIEQGVVIERFEINGRVSPRLETAVYPSIEGLILDLDVRQGDFVAAGDRLARFDFSVTEEEIASLYTTIAEKQAFLSLETTKQASAVERAQIELDIAQLELDLAQETAAAQPAIDHTAQITLLTRKVTLAQGDLDLLQRAIDPEGTVAAEISEAKERIAELEASMEIKSIQTPLDGMILGINMTAGSRVGEEQAVAMIGQMGSVDDVSISATGVRSETLERLSEGMAVSLTFASESDQSYPATIVRLPYPYNSGGNELGFDSADKAVRILPDDLNLLNRFKLGEVVEITMLLDENPEALWLPAEAVREFSGRTFIVVQDGNREQRIDVEIGLQGDGRVEILGTVEVGQQVVGP